ncbi:MAG: RidA family protein [Candidatus Caldatribacteriaceae bacterium]
MDTLYQRLQALGLKLPPPPQPVGAYVPALQVGNLVFTSGQLPLREGALVYRGKLGDEVSVAEGKKAAELCVLNALSAIEAVIGNLERIKQVVRVVGYVASLEGFTAQPQVLNGASELLVHLFGERGKHVRVAIGVQELPLGAPVELEMMVMVE